MRSDGLDTLCSDAMKSRITPNLRNSKLMLNKRLLLSAISVAALSTAVPSYAYDWEVDLSVAKQESSSDLSYTGSVEYFFAPLTHGTDAPWAELAFTDRLASVGFGTSYSSQESENTSMFWFSSPPKLKSTSKAYAVAYNHRKDSSPHSFSLGLGYNRIEFQFPQLSWWDGVYPWGTPTYTVQYQTAVAKTYTYHFGYDYYLQDNWTVGASLSLNESSLTDTYKTTLSTNRLWDLGNQKWIGIQASITNDTTKATYFEDNTLSFGLEGRYYFTTRTGVSLGLTARDGLDYKKTVIGVQHYFTDRASVTLAYEYTKIEVKDYVAQILPDGSVSTPDDSSSVLQAKFGLSF